MPYESWIGIEGDYKHLDDVNAFPAKYLGTPSIEEVKSVPKYVNCFRIFQSRDFRRAHSMLRIETWGRENWQSINADLLGLSAGSWDMRPKPVARSGVRLRALSPPPSGEWIVHELTFFLDAACNATPNTNPAALPS